MDILCNLITCIVYNAMVIVFVMIEFNCSVQGFINVDQFAHNILLSQFTDG